MSSTARRDWSTSRRRVAWGAAALVLALGAGALLVFTPTPQLPSAAIQGISDFFVDAGAKPRPTAKTVEFLLNVALFVPGSFAAAMIWRRVPWWRWVLLGLAVSACIEGAQWAFLSGRTAQVRDLVSNTLGAAVGAGAWMLLHRRRSR